MQDLVPKQPAIEHRVVEHDVAEARVTQGGRIDAAVLAPLVVGLGKLLQRGLHGGVHDTTDAGAATTAAGGAAVGVVVPTATTTTAAVAVIAVVAVTVVAATAIADSAAARRNNAAHR